MGTLAHPWSDNVELMEMAPVKVQEWHSHKDWRWKLLLASDADLNSHLPQRAWLVLPHLSNLYSPPLQGGVACKGLNSQADWLHIIQERLLASVCW